MSRFFCNPGRMEFPFTGLRKTMGKASLGGKIRTSLLDIASFRCLSQIQVKILNRKLDI